MQKKKNQSVIWSLSPVTVVVQEIEFNFTVTGWTLHFDPDFMGPSTECNYHNIKYLCLKDFHSHIVINQAEHDFSMLWIILEREITMSRHILVEKKKKLSLDLIWKW